MKKNTAKPVNLRCEYLKDPIGIDEIIPRLFWECLSKSRGVKQTAYQIIVSDSEVLLSKWQQNSVAGESSH